MSPKKISANRRILRIAILLVLLGVGGGTVQLLGKGDTKVVSEPAKTVEPPVHAQAPAPLPGSVSLAVPFTPQAPFAVWDNFHEQSCEEAAILMAMHYVNGEGAGLLNPSLADSELHKIVDWETAQGLPQDLTAQQSAQVFNGYYNYANASLSTRVSADSIKHQLADGNLVILPEAGRELHNPDYTPPGPWYHFILIKGYDDKGNFITNDAGIRQGEGWAFPESVIIAANHDWAGQDPRIDQGRRVMIIVKNRT